MAYGDNGLILLGADSARECRRNPDDLLEKEAQELTQAARDERTETRQGYRQAVTTSGI